MMCKKIYATTMTYVVDYENEGEIEIKNHISTRGNGVVGEFVYDPRDSLKDRSWIGVQRAPLYIPQGFEDGEVNKIKTVSIDQNGVIESIKDDIETNWFLILFIARTATLSVITTHSGEFLCKKIKAEAGMNGDDHYIYKYMLIKADGLQNLILNMRDRSYVFTESTGFTKYTVLKNIYGTKLDISINGVLLKDMIEKHDKDGYSFYKIPLPSGEYIVVDDYDISSDSNIFSVVDKGKGFSLKRRPEHIYHEVATVKGDFTIGNEQSLWWLKKEIHKKVYGTKWKSSVAKDVLI